MSLRPAQHARPRTRPPAAPRIAVMIVLVAVLAIASGLAVWFRGEANQLRNSAAAQNQALVDEAATRQVRAQIIDALQARFSTTVTHAAVRLLEGDHALVLVFLDREVQPGQAAGRLSGATRLTVTAQRVDGRWTIAGLQAY